MRFAYDLREFSQDSRSPKKVSIPDEEGSKGVEVPVKLNDLTPAFTVCCGHWLSPINTSLGEIKFSRFEEDSTLFTIINEDNDEITARAEYADSLVKCPYQFPIPMIDVFRDNFVKALVFESNVAYNLLLVSKAFQGYVERGGFDRFSEEAAHALPSDLNERMPALYPYKDSKMTLPLTKFF